MRRVNAEAEDSTNSYAACFGSTPLWIDVRPDQALPRELLRQYRIVELGHRATKCSTEGILSTKQEISAAFFSVFCLKATDTLQSAFEASEELRLFMVTQLNNWCGLEFAAVFTDELAQMARKLGSVEGQAPTADRTSFVTWARSSDRS